MHATGKFNCQSVKLMQDAHLDLLCLYSVNSMQARQGLPSAGVLCTEGTHSIPPVLDTLPGKSFFMMHRQYPAIDS